jgi:hypothetical protein
MEQISRILNKEERRMNTIDKIWFSGDRIFMQTEQGKVFSRPLEKEKKRFNPDCINWQKNYLVSN